MRILIGILLAVPFGIYGQTGTCANVFEAPAKSEREIAMNLRSGDITITGSDTPVVRVSCTRGNSDIRISFAANHLTIRGGPDHDVAFRIEVPRATSIRVRASAGDLTISGISGDKDVHLNAGDLIIHVGEAGAYRHVEASVWAGDLRATAFGVENDGLFRSFKRDNPAGRYTLRAGLLAGDLTLR
jgi:putative adhesin